LVHAGCWLALLAVRKLVIARFRSQKTSTELLEMGLVVTLELVDLCLEAPDLVI
jgi:hypothetical protein